MSDLYVKFLPNPTPNEHRILDQRRMGKNLLNEECGCEIETMEVMPDHIHLFVKGNPTIPIHLIVKNLKGKSSRMLRQEFPSLNTKLPCLWTRSYYCETIGCINEETIKKYIENQKFN